MKQAKKLAAVLLSLVLVLALAVPASAAGNYTITITNDQAGHTYEAYQIFAGDVSDDITDNATDTGPILSNITWGSGVDNTRYAALLAALQADATIGVLEGMRMEPSAQDLQLSMTPRMPLPLPPLWTKLPPLKQKPLPMWCPGSCLIPQRQARLVMEYTPLLTWTPATIW